LVERSEWLKPAETVNLRGGGGSIRPCFGAGSEKRRARIRVAAALKPAKGQFRPCEPCLPAAHVGPLAQM